MAEYPSYDRLRTSAFRGLLVKAFKVFPSRLGQILEAEGWRSFTDFMAAVDRMGRVLLQFQRPRVKAVEEGGVRAAIDEARREANTEAMLKLLAAAFVNKPGEEPDADAVLEAFSAWNIRNWYDLSMAVETIAQALFMDRTGGQSPLDVAKPETQMFYNMRLDAPPEYMSRVVEAFGLSTQNHLEALLSSFYAGELTLEDLDRGVRRPEILTEAVNRSPSNPHKGIVFGAPASPSMGARRRRAVRPVVRSLVEAVAFDLFPDSPAVLADFWITDQAHYEALYYPIRAGEISEEDLDRALGDPEALTALVNRAPSNPHKGIVFGEGGSASLQGALPRTKPLLLASDADRKGRPGEFVAVVGEEWESGRSVVEGWRGPGMDSEDFARSRLAPIECGTVLVDIGGYWDCIPPGITVIS